MAKRVLSIHALPLGTDEAAEATISFRTFTNLSEYRFYLREEDKFVGLFAALFRRTDVFYLDAASPVAQPLESWQKLLDLTTTGLREKDRFLLYFRRYQLLLASAPSLHLAVYFLNPQHQATFTELARAYQLHLR
jgi:hypothetical protein